MTFDDAPRVVRRRRGPFKRSRTGCGTCKRRGKKCDEIWSPEGFCQRCLAGPWECSGRSPGPAHRDELSGSDHAMGVGSLGASGPMGGGAAAPLQSTMAMGMTATGSVSSSNVAGPSMTPVGGMTPTGAHLSPGVQVLSSRSESVASISGSSPPLINGVNPVHGNRANVVTNASAVMAAASALAPSQGVMAGGDGVGYYAGLWNGYINARPGSSGSSLYTQHSHQHTHQTVHQPHAPQQQTFQQQQQQQQQQLPSPLAQPLFDWPSAVGSMPSAVLTTTADGGLAIDAPQTQPLDSLQDFWNDISASFSAGNLSFNPASRVLFLNSDTPMRQGVSLAEIYARVVESWLVGLPGPTRDYARARILALHDSNSVIRGVRYAVAAAYIFLFASDPHADPRAESQDPKPKLVELACRGAGLVDGSRAADEAPGDGALKKLRFYVDHVSTPFAGDIESTKWTEDAVQELRQVIVMDRRQLSDLLWGVIDLQLVEFIRGGAAPSYNMLALGDRLVRSVFGCDHPPITLSDLRSSETFSLRLFGLSDVSRCIVQRGRRTIFRFNTNDEAAALPLTSEDETWSTYLGLPDAIVILLAEIANLCADASTASSLTREAVKTRADDLERSLRSWTPTPAMGVEAAALISRTIAGELWRISAMVLLYQSVHRVGSLHPVLRRARVELLTLLASVTQLPNGDLWGFIALPSFLAATLSVDEADRERAMTFLVRAGPERVWLDNIALVEKVWEEMDESGRNVDWHDKMVREGLSVAFF